MPFFGASGGGGPKFDVAGGNTGPGDGEMGCQKVDFLFVIDNSGSMEDEQNNLINSFPGFINTIMISAIKQLSADLHAFEIAFFRCMIGFLVLLPVVWRAGGLVVLRTEHLGLHVFRGVLNAGGMLLFFWAISLAPLATVSAIGFASPLFAALLAIPILGERVGLRRWSGLIIGFAGTLIILRPGAGVVSALSLRRRGVEPGHHRRAVLERWRRRPPHLPGDRGGGR